MHLTRKILEAAQRVNYTPGGSYLCGTCKETVPPGAEHLHGCPLEGGECGARTCNVAGACQA